MKPWICLFFWTQGLLGGVLMVCLGDTVIAMPIQPSKWERALDPGTPDAWSLGGFQKRPIPSSDDFPWALECGPLPSLSEHRDQHRRLFQQKQDAIRKGSGASEFLDEIAKDDRRDFWKILACHQAARAILRSSPADNERVTISDRTAWDTL